MRRLREFHSAPATNECMSHAKQTIVTRQLLHVCVAPDICKTNTWTLRHRNFVKAPQSHQAGNSMLCSRNRKQLACAASSVQTQFWCIVRTATTRRNSPPKRNAPSRECTWVTHLRAIVTCALLFSSSWPVCVPVTHTCVEAGRPRVRVRCAGRPRGRCQRRRLRRAASRSVPWRGQRSPRHGLRGVSGAQTCESQRGSSISFSMHRIGVRGSAGVC